MLRLTIAAVVAAAGGTIALPVSADTTHDYRKSVSRSHNLASRHYHRNRNWNANEEYAVNRLRLPITSTNTVSPTVNVSPVAEPAVTVVPTA
jgi:hypothetical protein